LKKFIKNYWKYSYKIIEKIHQKFVKKVFKNFIKNPQKIVPGLAKKYFFTIKLKISTNLFSIKINQKLLKKIIKNCWKNQ
jgi:uncharacterized protein YaaW (UPF0174 family)